MRIATAAYPVEVLPDWSAYDAKLRRWVAQADADLLVFPEYAGLEPALIGDARATVPRDWCSISHNVADRAAETVAAIARQAGCLILAGSAPVKSVGAYVNRTCLFGPTGLCGHQDKLIPTPYERDVLGLSGGDGLRLFDSAFGRIAVLICYDGEFPLLARAAIEGGADIIVIPSATEAVAGYWRVRIGAMARALECQCVTVMASLVGDVPSCDIIDESRGTAGIFCPPDHGWSETGVIASGVLDDAGWTVAEIDPAARAARIAGGAVANVAHWDEQDARAQIIEVVKVGAT